MDTLTVLLILAGGYCILLFFDLFFKSCAHYPYLKLLDALGIKISYFSIKWKTKALNRMIIKWGNTRSRFWELWFEAGIYTSLAFLPIALYILLYSILNFLFGNKLQESTPLITPVLPGVNLPMSELGYYSFTILVCSVVHELGHALAATVEDVGTLELGCNLYFILPVAFVILPTDKLLTLNLKKRLSIFCAGVWHNILLSFIAYLLYCSLPSIFSPLFDYEKGISISEVTKTSPLKDTSKGLVEGDVILGINTCAVRSGNDWYDCLNNKDMLIPALCITSDLVNIYDESVPLKHLGSGYIECCDSKNHKNLCFEYIDIGRNELELPGHVCLPGRKVLEESNEFCTFSPHSCPSDLYCFKPILPNNTYLFKIETTKKVIIYLGHPNDIFQTIEISSYIKKNTIFPVSFPNRVTKLVKYIVVISLGLAFLNILPFTFMDGEYIFQAIALIIFKNKVSKRQVVHGVSVITWISTVLLIIYLIWSLLMLL